jgi:DNA-binding response OmpR family regulator
MRVLVVEDYPPIRNAVTQALREARYAVDEAVDGEAALALARAGTYDALVLDLQLPRLDGLEVLRSLRQAGVNTHVLVLTARDQVSDRVTGLDSGADDYLIKPFVIAELLARVRALVRRSYRRKNPLAVVGHIELDTAKHTLRVAGSAVELTAKEYALLEYLVMRRGEVVTRGDIWEHVYDERSDATSNVVDVYIGYLRKKIERPGLPRLIHTRRGEGYIFEAGEPS